MNENLHILKILSDIAETTFRTRRSSISRIEASGFTIQAKKDLKEEIIKPLDDTIDYISNEIRSTLIMIPIYNFFLENQKGVNIYDSAQLISILEDIDNFKTFGNLFSYAGFTPNAKRYNKKLHKILLRLSYRLIKTNPQYQFIFEINYKKYAEKNPRYPKQHIENMAKRIVIKKFLKNLYFSWNQINKEDF